MMPRVRLIPPSERLGLSRAEAAEYVGVVPSLFDQMVNDGRMPPPKLINTRRVWARSEIERHFWDLPSAGHSRQSVAQDDEIVIG